MASGLLASRFTYAAGGGTVNNLNPGSGWATMAGGRLLITPSANTILTGLLASLDGTLVEIWNNATIGAGYTLTLENLNAGSTAANQFTCSGSALILVPQQRTFAVYDATLALWSIG